MVKFILNKRTSKNVSIEQYEKDIANQKKRGQKASPAPKFMNLDRRYRFLRPTKKLQDLDVNVAHYINEIRILPYSHEIDNIGKPNFLQNLCILTLKK